MSKRTNDVDRSNSGTGMTDAAGAAAADVLEQRVVAFAEQLGRIAGTVQARADALMDREALASQIASVRDGAIELLAHLTGNAKKGSRKASGASVARGNAGRRSRGAVDAPGKKHRKPPPDDPKAGKSASQAAKMRAARPMVKTNRRRGRG